MVTSCLILSSSHCCTSLFMRNTLKFMCLRPQSLLLREPFPNSCLSLPHHHFTTLFTIACSQVVPKDSNPVAICIDLSVEGTSLFYFNPWFLVATASVQVLSWPNCKCISVQIPLMPLAKIHNCSHPLHWSRWARCELLPCPANWSSHSKLWGWGSGQQTCSQSLSMPRSWGLFPWEQLAVRSYPTFNWGLGGVSSKVALKRPLLLGRWIGHLEESNSAWKSFEGWNLTQ